MLRTESHYGIKVGDRVRYTRDDDRVFVVVDRSMTDNNRVFLRDVEHPDHKPFPAVAEWCIRIPKPPTGSTNNRPASEGRRFLYCDGFYVVEMYGRKFDVCVIAGCPRFARSEDSEPITDGMWDILANAEGRWWEAGPFVKAD